MYLESVGLALSHALKSFDLNVTNTSQPLLTALSNASLEPKSNISLNITQSYQPFFKA
jgi:hypothetical protein